MDEIRDFFKNNYDQILQLKNKKKTLDEMLEHFGLVASDRERQVYAVGYQNCQAFSSMMRSIDDEIENLEESNDVNVGANATFSNTYDRKTVDLTKAIVENSKPPSSQPPRPQPKSNVSSPAHPTPNATSTSSANPPASSHQVTVLKEIECKIKVFIEELMPVVTGELSSKRKDGKSLIENFVWKKITRTTTMLSDKEKISSLIEPIIIRDEFGEYKFDLTFGIISLTVQLPNNQSFPKMWRCDPKSTKLRIYDPELIRKDSNLSLADDDMSLRSWLLSVAEKYNKANKVDVWFNALREQDVETLDDLLKWQEQDWDRFSKISITAKVLIRQHLNEVKLGQKRGSRAAQSGKGLSQAEKFAYIHKIRRLFYYEAYQEDEIPYLDSKAVARTFEEMKQEYEGEYLLNQIKQFFDAYTLQSTKYVKLNRGLLLHGPPGTGKTQITSGIANKIGLTEVVQPLAAAEVNRSLVGQTEKILLDLCNRARRVPHLLCCISIDEIDSLAPKRDAGSSEHKVDALSVLLAVIGGIKDVPNLIFLASTNRLNMMDEAFLRRMSGKFFVGRPGRKSRETILRAVEEHKLKIPDDQMRFLVTLTTNFSGAAMVQLRSNLIVYSKMTGKMNLTNEELLDQAVIISNQFSIRLGNYSLPLVLKTNKELLQAQIADSKATASSSSITPNKNYTGRIHIDLKKKCIQIERDVTVEEKPIKGLSSTFKVLPWLADFAFNRSLDYIQLFDLDLLLSNAAFDDNKAMESLTNAVNECGEYPRSMAIFDMDSLVGVNDNESVSNMVRFPLDFLVMLRRHFILEY